MMLRATPLRREKKEVEKEKGVGKIKIMFGEWMPTKEG
jgi:hypothetical protein